MKQIFERIHSLVILFFGLVLLQLSSTYCSANQSESIEQIPENETKWMKLFNKHKSYMSFAESHFPITLGIDRYFSLINFAIGLPGNLISFIVWSRKRIYRGNSAAIYLAALSLNDFLLLNFMIVRDLDRVWDIEYVKLNSCDLIRNFFSSYFQYTSNVYILGFTFERWLAICMPFKQDRICSTKKALISSIVICLASFLICLLLFITDEIKCTTSTTVVIIFELFYTLCIPMVVLILNILVIRAMIRIIKANKKLKLIAQPAMTAPNKVNHDAADADRNLLTKTRPTRQTKIQNRTMNKIESKHMVKDQPNHKSSFRSTTITLLAISFYMIICVFLAGVLYPLELILLPKNHQYNDQQVIDRYINFKAVQDIMNEIALTHFVVGFFIYYITGSNFRETFHSLFQSCCGRIGHQHRTKEKRDRNRVVIKNAKIQNSTVMRFTNRMQGIFKKEKVTPGLEDCGQRNYRRPSPLQKQQNKTTQNNNSEYTNEVVIEKIDL